ncbi:hypothetical protein [Marinobacter sp. F4216]|uniref:hypothetical protein n=1 Tax=Marinobacter sp. F4216 TaxID=2874281 RepID=UPI001CC0296F|nr:hypothetical protein [Marinobacter sp. F4216]MBZ2167434.1 hypothetical protein [Marinobacter sp. F4216]
MATLYLPSAWTEENRIAFQVGLTSALSEGLGQPPEHVHMVTMLVAFGDVVKGGKSGKSSQIFAKVRLFSA